MLLRRDGGQAEEWGCSCVGMEGRQGVSDLPAELSSSERPLLLIACAPAHQASQNFFDRLGRSAFLRQRNHLSTFLTGRSHRLAKLIRAPWKTGKAAVIRSRSEGLSRQHRHCV